MNNKIFISIASYRDPETIPTILDAIKKAKYPENLVFGLLLQDDGDIVDTSEIENNKNIKILQYDWRESQGTCWARSVIQDLLYTDEEYYLQLDSHHRFCDNWDSILIDLFLKLKVEYNKPIIGGYCPGYKPTDKKLKDNPCRICCYPDFTSQGDLVFYPKGIKDFLNLRKQKIEYIPARFLSGHFIFTIGEFCRECPYDPNLYFRGEEISLSARAYTHGYDFFHPTQSIIWHEYIRADQNKHWNDHVKENGFIIPASERSDRAKARVRYLLNMESSSISFKKYGLGNQRPLHDYELYAGVDFKSRKIHKYSYDVSNRNIYPAKMPEVGWINGLMNKYKLELPIPNDFFSEMTSSDTTQITIVPESRPGLPVYRKDIKEKDLLFLKNPIKLESSMEDRPNQISLSIYKKDPSKTKKISISNFIIN
jgi:hypothetical protein